MIGYAKESGLNKPWFIYLFRVPKESRANKVPNLGLSFFCLLANRWKKCFPVAIGVTK
jgi:hypothetical protein